jgi:hypothetical protein
VTLSLKLLTSTSKRISRARNGGNLIHIVHNCVISFFPLFSSWSGFGDELAWGAAWLYRATGEQKYLNDAKRFQAEFSQVNGRPAQFGWDDKTAGFQVRMPFGSSNNECLYFVILYAISFYFFNLG